MLLWMLFGPMPFAVLHLVRGGIGWVSTGQAELGRYSGRVLRFNIYRVTQAVLRE